MCLYVVGLWGFLSAARRTLTWTGRRKGTDLLQGDHYATLINSESSAVVFTGAGSAASCQLVSSYEDRNSTS